MFVKRTLGSSFLEPEKKSAFSFSCSLRTKLSVIAYGTIFFNFCIYCWLFEYASNSDQLIIVKKSDLYEITSAFLLSTLLLPITLNIFLKRVFGAIEAVSNSMRNYAEVNGKIEVHPYRETDEIGLLTQSFSILIEELEKHKLNLNEEVAKKTVELREAKKQAEIASESKSQFLSVISHELRTPLNGITSYTQLIKLSSLTQTQTQDLCAIESCAKSLLQMVEDILEFSKLDSRSIELISEPIYLPAFLNLIGQRTEELTREKSQTFILHVDQNIPELVMGDANKLEHLLMHLLRNAVKFSPNNSGIMLLVKTDHKDENTNLVHFAISDTGKGISAKNLSQIFDPFLQEDDSYKRNYGGLGLGLSICNQLVLLMNGSIWVKTKENIGSAFHFAIPLKDPPNSSKEKNETNYLSI